MRYKRAILTFAVTTAFLMCAGTASVHAEQIDSFNSKLQVQNDGTLKVTETILYNPQNAPHHGILRNIPLKNAQGGTMQISDVSIVDERGVPYQFTSSGFGEIDLKVGDPVATFSTPKTYIISYAVSGAYSYYQNFDEIYWNVTGNSWTFPIMKASAEVDLPSGVNVLQSACYYGISGSKNSCDASSVLSTDRSTETFYAPGELNFGEGLTVAAGFPKGVIPLETLSTKSKTIVFSYLWILTLLIIPVPMFLLLLRSWLRKGRAPKGTGVIVPQYDAPNGMTPINMAGVLHENVPSKAISAEIVYLATKGFVKIVQSDDKIMGLSIKDYELQKVKELDGTYSLSDQKIMEGLFRSSTSVKISSLKRSFFAYVSLITKAVLDELVGQGFFRESPTKTKNLLRVIGILLIFVAIFLGLSTSAFLSVVIGSPAAISFFIGIGIAAVIFIVFSFMTSARTADGVTAKEWILGFKEYLQIAEKARIDFANAPEKKPETFEKFLPYAMVLGVEKAWATEFEDIYKTAPSWYSGPSGTVFSAVVFTHHLSSFSSMMSSSVSSGRGGSGGGGFSGGGGGGGGGGSW